jgi:hypothetical protein
LVFLIRHDSHARGTRLPSFGATVERCLGIAIFAFPWDSGFREIIDELIGGISFDIFEWLVDGGNKVVWIIAALEALSGLESLCSLVDLFQVYND